MNECTYFFCHQSMFLNFIYFYFFVGKSCLVILSLSFKDHPGKVTNLKLSSSFLPTIEKSYRSKCFMAFDNMEPFDRTKKKKSSTTSTAYFLTQWIFMEFRKYLPKSIMLRLTFFFHVLLHSKLSSNFLGNCELPTFNCHSVNNKRHF